MANRLNNKVALITGGATGIGEAISKKFASEGATVVVNGLPGDPIDKLVESIRESGGKAYPFTGDVSEPEIAEKCVHSTAEIYGKLDVLVNNAGMYPEISTIESFDLEAYDQMIKNNLRSAFLMTKFAIPELKKTKGNIVSAGSEAGKIGLAQNAPYGGTKGFMHAFMKGVAAEQAKNGIRANCICPGPIDTSWTRKENSKISDQMEDMLIAATPMGRRGNPEEVANAYLFLASDEASYITGTLLSVDGGITISKGPMGKQVPDEFRKQPTPRQNLQHQYEGQTEKR
jgi:NAD(P)-dependent dehydrogenase (short-subunit alcohol dehydrogenase family)